MYESRIKHLEEIHAALNKKIDGLEKTGVFDDDHLADLKKQRLNVKDNITKLRAMHREKVNHSEGRDGEEWND